MSDLATAQSEYAAAELDFEEAQRALSVASERLARAIRESRDNE